MLSSLLPGFRDLRVPLAAGAMWLVAIWLWVYPAVPSREDASGLLAAGYTVGAFFGPPAVVAALTFVAYLIGIFQAQVGHGMIRVVDHLFGQVGRINTVRDRLSAPSRAGAEAVAQAVVAEAAVEKVGLPSIVDGEIYWPVGPQPRPRYTPEDRARSVDDITRQMISERELVATRLLKDSRDLFDRYDRAKTEASFRLCLIAPISVVLGVLIYRAREVSLPAAIGLILVLLLAFCLLAGDAGRKTVEANDAIFQATFAGAADFPVIETLRLDIRKRTDSDSARSAGRGSPRTGTITETGTEH